MRNKLIQVNTDEDYIRLVKNIKFYKTALYFNTFFEVENNINNDNVYIMCRALNIKNRKKRIEYIYDQACNIIDNKTNGINICGFKNNKCYAQRELKNNKCNGCCRKCLYQSKKGYFTKNLACKLFNCSEVRKRYDVLTYKDMDVLKLLSIRQRFIVKSDYFSTREDVLKDLYSISIIYSTLRIVCRITKSFILLNKNNIN